MCSKALVQLHIGQAGVQMANACWELYCLEHGITASGCSYCNNSNDFCSFFSAARGAKVVPRTVLVDTEPNVIGEIREGAYRFLFDPSTLITGKTDAANNYAKGYYTLGNEMIDITMDTVRKVVEKAPALQGFLIFHSIGGGTGSGFGTKVLEYLDRDYAKTPKLQFVVFPSPVISSVVVEPYNAVLSLHSSMDFADCCILMDNQASYDVCASRLNVDYPTYTNLNRLIAQVVSTITTPLRFDGAINVGFNELQTNLVPYPRIHFPLATYAPLLPLKRSAFENSSTHQITLQCFEPSNQLVKCNPSHGKFMSCVLLYRGDVQPYDISTAIEEIKSKKSILFVDWSPTGFKTGLNYQPPICVPGGDLAPTNRAVCMISNNTAVRSAFSRIVYKFDNIMSKRGFVHHFVGEGLEEGELMDARQNICELVKDYKEVEIDADES